MSNEEEMIELTKDMLVNYEEKCLPPKEAIFEGRIGKKNILVLGLNPAGNEQDVDREKDCKIFLNYVKYKEEGKEQELRGKLVNNGYFKPIYNLVNEVYKKDEKDEDKANFPWQNKKFDEIKKEIEKIEDEKNIKILEKHFNELKREYTILIGDLFYYHETSSKDFIKKINDKDKDFHKNVRDMLDLHIKKVLSMLSKKDTLEFILINNARASEYIIEALGKGPITYCDYQYEDESRKESIPIFFSGMLSNGGESKYGKQRLINEIKKRKGIA